MRYLLIALLLAGAVMGCKKAPEPEKKTGKERYLMVSRADRPPFIYYIECDTRKTMERRQRNFHRIGRGAKGVTKAEYEAWMEKR